MIVRFLKLAASESFAKASCLSGRQPDEVEVELQTCQYWNLGEKQSVARLLLENRIEGTGYSTGTGFKRKLWSWIQSRFQSFERKSSSESFYWLVDFAVSQYSTNIHYRAKTGRNRSERKDNESEASRGDGERKWAVSWENEKKKMSMRRSDCSFSCFEIARIGFMDMAVPSMISGASPPFRGARCSLKLKKRKSNVKRFKEVLKFSVRAITNS